MKRRGRERSGANDVEALLAALRDRKDQLIKDWIASIRADPRIPQARRLSDEDLQDYTPVLLDELMESLARRARASSAAGASGLDIGAGSAAVEHVHHRFEQGYTLAEEMLELAHIRAAIIDLCTERGVCLVGPEAQLVHSAIDEVMNTAAVEMERMTSAQLRQEVELRELLMGVLGHDLRNPISAIQFATGCLMKHEDMPERFIRFLQRIANSAVRMESMVKDLLDLTRVRAAHGLPVERKATDLIPICEQTIAELQLIHTDRSIRLHAEGDTRGEWDPDRLTQVVSNLAGNAIRYSPPRTPVDVEVRGEDDKVRLIVKNRGTPIQAATLEVIFDPFRRGDRGDKGARPSEGLGLGLFIVSEIVKAHEGAIDVISDDARGTVFTVTLPRTG